MRWLKVVSLLLLVACQFRERPPALAVITCEQSDECLRGHVCSSGVCISSTRPVRNVVLTPVQAKAGDVVTVRFEGDFSVVSERVLPLKPGALRALGAGGQLVPFELSSPETGGRLLIDAAGALPDGVTRVLVDLETNQNRTFLGVELGRIVIDREPPTVERSTLEYEALPGNVLLRVGQLERLGAAAPQSRVTVRVRCSEPVRRAPLPSLQVDGRDVAFVLDGAASSEVDLVFVARIEPGQDGAWPLRLITTDVAGNEADVRLPVPLRTDSTPEAAPRTDVENAFVLRREPFGGPDAGGQARWTVEAMPGAVPIDGVLVASVNGAILGGAPVSVDGGGLVRVVGRDEPRVAVQFVDAAGNLSAPAIVRDVEWVAWFGPGAASGSPHRAFPRGERRPELRGEHELGSLTSVWPLDVSSGLALRGAPPYLTSANGQQLWFDPVSARVKGALSGDGLSPVSACPSYAPIIAGRCPSNWLRVDSDGGSFVLSRAIFREDSGDVVALTSTHVVLQAPPTEDGGVVAAVRPDWALPAGLSVPALGYDPVLEAVLLFGGQWPDGGFSNDLYRLDESGWHLVPESTRPPARRSAAMGSALGRGVFIGAGFADAPLDDIWLHDTRGWTHVADGGLRSVSGLAFDPTRGRLIALGGSNAIEVTLSGSVLSFGERPFGDEQWACVSGKPPCLGSRLSWWDRALRAGPAWPFGERPVPGVRAGAVVVTTSTGLYTMGDGGFLLDTAFDGVVIPTALATRVDGGLSAATPVGLFELVVDGGWRPVFTVQPDAGQVASVAATASGLVGAIARPSGGEVIAVDEGDGVSPVFSREALRPVALAWDSRRARTLILGELLIERTSGTSPDRLALLTSGADGTTLEVLWPTEAADSTPFPGPFSMTVLSERDELLITTGRTGPFVVPLDEREAPEVVFAASTVDFATTLPRGSRIDRVTFDGVVGATSLSADAGVDGVVVEVFQEGLWVQAFDGGLAGGSATEPRRFHLDVTDAATVRRLTRLRQPLGLSVSGQRRRVRDESRVAVDSLEAVIRFRRPP